jgi:hypothetical protein
MEQIEQLQSVTRRRAGAWTSNLTRPQWQPPVCVTMSIDPFLGWLAFYPGGRSACLPSGDPMRPSPASFEKAAEAALQDTVPLRHNGYKMTLVRALVRRALQELDH